MTHHYFATFISGTEEIVSSILRQRLKDLELHTLSPGAVTFSSATPYSDLNLHCFNNIFQVIYSAPAAPTKAGLEKFLRSLPTSPANWQAAGEGRGKAKTFRLVVSCKNQLMSVSKGVKSAVENKLAAVTKLRPDRSLPDREFWALVRDDGRAWFLKRLSRHRAYDKLLHPGELHPELAYMMCWLSRPGPNDMVVDPFCGYGAIPQQRCGKFPFRRLCAFDTAPKPLEITRQKLGSRSNIAVENRDALCLSQILPPASVDAVITDPPWGIYEQVGMELEEFYQRFLGEVVNVLRPEGRAVVLTAAKQELCGALEAQMGLVLVRRYDILVSGKKCGLFLICREGDKG